MLNLQSGVTVPAAGSASAVAVRRLQKDYAKLMQDPVDGIAALPNEDNILEWHYCLRGSPDTPFEGGYYWGKVIFKENFPWSPPAITMITPNGRFSTNTRLCLSISDYHPESWNPGWTVSAILIGLHSFMNENQPAAGAIPGTPQEQRNLAAASKEFNCKYKEFRRFFPSFVQEWTGVLPTPNEPNVAPVMLPAHATPTGIAVPHIQHHSSRGAYAAAHAANHMPLGALDAQFENMLNAVRNPALNYGIFGAPLPNQPAPQPMPQQQQPLNVAPGVPGGIYLPNVPNNNPDPAQIFYHDYMMGPPGPRQRLRGVDAYPPGGQARADRAAERAARMDRLMRFNMEQINGGRPDPQPQPQPQQDNAPGGGGRRRGPQEVDVDDDDDDDEDVAPPKRARPEDKVITLD